MRALRRQDANRYCGPATPLSQWARATCLGLAIFLNGCASESPKGVTISENDARAVIRHAIPGNVADKSGWTEDIYEAFTVQGLSPTRENVCATVAIIEQESNFQVNPVIPGLPAIAWKEIRTRAEHVGVPWVLVHTTLDLKSPSGVSYAARIDKARTEKDLSDIYEDLIGSVPLGRTLFEEHNPIRTRGPMQVNVAFLKRADAVHSYPYPVKATMADELFTRRGSVYYGVAHLLGYSAPYPHMLYRFADFNAGQYASRNAAFQNAVSIASGRPLVADGALLPHDGSLGNTEAAVRELGARLNADDSAIHDALEEGNSADFERSKVYKRVFNLAEQSKHSALPHALLPQIKLEGPKISRQLTTDWYAHRVDGRYQQCLKHP
jgi:Protein of unknown function (DUF1615)